MPTQNPNRNSPCPRNLSLQEVQRLRQYNHACYQRMLLHKLNACLIATTDELGSHIKDDPANPAHFDRLMTIADNLLSLIIMVL